MDLIREHPTSSALSASSFSAEEARLLVQAGFLTLSFASFTSVDALSQPSVASSGTLLSLSRVGSQEFSGSMAAIGGESAFQDAGGGTGSLNQQRQGVSNSTTHHRSGQLFPCLPNMGPYLRLLSDARNHHMSLLSKSKYREAPLDLLRERWDGGIATSSMASMGKQARGEFAGVLPGRTRKWKQFYGLSYEWILRECLGAGLVEVFETGSVGKGVRSV